MTPAELAASKAGELLDDDAEHLDDTVHVNSCVTVAEAWMRLHMVLATGADVTGRSSIPNQGTSRLIATPIGIDISTPRAKNIHC